MRVVARALTFGTNDGAAAFFARTNNFRAANSMRSDPPGA
jgi:hypothetical protein